MTYDPYAIFQSFEANPVPIAALAILAFAFNGVFFYEAARIGFKQKTYVFPLWALTFYMAHDLSYVLLYEKWFKEYDFWLLQFFWVALIFTFFTESLYLRQYLKYARQEVFPNISQKLFTFLVIGAIPLVFLMWLNIKSAVDDDIYLIAFAVTVFWNAPVATQMLWQRRSRKGQSVLFHICIIGMQLPFNTALYLLDPFFRTPLFLSMMAVTTIWSIANIMLYLNLPAYDETELTPQSV